MIDMLIIQSVMWSSIQQQHFNRAAARAKSEDSSSDQGSTSTSKDADVYTYPDLIRGVPRWIPQPLPLSLNVDGKHVWESPIFGYNALIDEEYEKKREAALKYTAQNCAKATEIMDLGTEFDLWRIYEDWTKLNIDEAHGDADIEKASFFAGLLDEMAIDRATVWKEYSRLGLREKKMKDGTWKFESLKSRLGLRITLSSDEDLSESPPFLSEKSPLEDEEDDDESQSEDESVVSFLRVFRPAVEPRTGSSLARLGLEAYTSDQSGEDADGEASEASSDSGIYTDARAALSESSSEEEEEGEDESRELKRRRID